MVLYQLIYQSQSLVPFEPAELSALLTHSRAKNERLEVSGVLLYTPDGRFLQVLEGSPDVVRPLYYQCIMGDARHYNCRVLHEGPAQSRSFTGWYMAFFPAQAHHLRLLLGTVPPNTLGLLVPRPHTRPEMLALLQGFVANNAGTSQPN